MLTGPVGGRGAGKRLWEASADDARVPGADRVRAHDGRVGITPVAADHSIGLAWRARGRPRYAERYLRQTISLYRDLGRRSEEAAVARDLAAAGSA